MKHFIIHRDSGVPDGYMAFAPCAKDAMRAYALKTFATEGSDGRLILDQPNKPRISFSHELEAIECCEKSCTKEWSMQEVRPTGWRYNVEDAFTGYNPWAIQEYVDICRATFPDATAAPLRSFAWYIYTGPLITFFRPRRGGIIRPSDIVGRYTIDWPGGPRAVPWTGDYDKLLSELNTYHPYDRAGPRWRTDENAAPLVELEI